MSHTAHPGINSSGVVPLSKIHREEEESLAKRFARSLNLPYLNLDKVAVDLESLVSVPEKQARKAQLAVIQKSGREIFIAVRNPELPAAKIFLERQLAAHNDIHLYVASRSSLEKAWRYYQDYHQPVQSLKSFLRIDRDTAGNFQQRVKDVFSLQKTLSDLEGEEMFQFVLTGALRARASDIHFEPRKSEVRIRYRIDGVLHDIAKITSRHHSFIISRVKVLAGLKLNIVDISQDGRFSIGVDDKTTIDVRVSVIPEIYGESIVLRLLGVGIAKLDMEDLGLEVPFLEKIKQQLARSHGMILNTGPTGSGKTTTLYAFLQHVNNPEINIITIEDPIEYQLEGITQSQVDEKRGYTFPTALKAILRQDPDVILIGEIRDSETAHIAIQAAMTGHLVFSTLHTNDAPSTIPRLIDLGVQERQMVTSINLVMAQRLIRRLCSHCKIKYTPSNEEEKFLRAEFAKIAEILNIKPIKDIPSLYRPKGCHKCFGLGYAGRIGIFEFFTISKEIERLILDLAPASAIHQAAQKEGMISLFQSGLLKVLQGSSDLGEIKRVVGGE